MVALLLARCQLFVTQVCPSVGLLIRCCTTSRLPSSRTMISCSAGKFLFSPAVIVEAAVDFPYDALADQNRSRFAGFHDSDEFVPKNSTKSRHIALEDLQILQQSR